MKKIIKIFLIQSILLLLLLLGLNLQAQVPTGHNLDFSTGGYQFWQAKTGNYDGTSSQPIFNWTSTWVDPTQASDEGERFFVIYNGGTDTNSLNQLSRVPEGFTHSSQINKAKGDGHCSQLQYTMEVNLENCLLTFMYAMVLQAPGHSGYENPTFQIDVMKHSSDNGQMLEELVDPCAFFEKSSNAQLPTTEPELWHEGSNDWHGLWIWSNWQQIKINLTRYIGDRITIRVRISDCYSTHGGYGYFTAKAEPALISTPGCAGNGDTVTVASAPGGFESYKWFEISSTFLSQDELADLDDNSPALSEDQNLIVTEAMMGNAQEKFYAVKLVSPRTQTTRPNCVAYITTKIVDIRPNFDNLTYTPPTAIDPAGRAIFMVNDVQPAAA